MVLLLKMLTDSGHHLTARDIWAFLIDLFFGWTCVSTSDDVDRQRGYFWNRVFDADNLVSQAIREHFDPLQVARARDDASIWRGQDESLALPMTPPRVVARTSVEDGLAMFTSGKRFFFFFFRPWEVDHTLSAFVPASQFGTLLERAVAGEDVAAEIAGLINNFRLGQRTQTDLAISRHDSFAAHKRPVTLAASGKVPSSSLVVRAPYSDDASAHPDSGFFPHRLLLGWPDNDQEFTVDFATWKELRGERNLIVDRNQETLDFALDIFLAQGNPPEAREPEITVFDHRRKRSTILRLVSAERRIEVL
jgi:hypothetical protein